MRRNFLLTIIPTLFLLMMSCEKANDHYSIVAETRIDALEAGDFILASTNVTYYNNCPDGSYGCGSSPGPPCNDPKQHQCKPLIPLKEFSCSLVGIYGCGPSNASGVICPVVTECPTPPEPPKNHVIPCMYGTIAFGCFSGWTSGPYCGTLVNCQIPPQ